MTIGSSVSVTKTTSSKSKSNGDSYGDSIGDSYDNSYDDQIKTVPSLYIDRSITRITVSVSFLLL